MGAQDATEQAAEYEGLRHNLSEMSLGALETLDAASSSLFNSNESLHRMDSSRRYLHTLESLASSAVRAADKVKAALIIVYTSTGALSPRPLNPRAAFARTSCPFAARPAPGAPAMPVLGRTCTAHCTEFIQSGFA